MRSEPLIDAALMAWATVGRATRTRPSVVTLNAHRCSTVYRFVGVGPRGTDVVAKRASRSDVEREYMLYTDLLADLPLSTLSCYGLADDGDPAMGWLFVEYAGEARYSPERSEHRVLAARWLATLHIAAMELDLAARLPRLSAPYYRALVECWRDGIAAGLGNPALTVGNVATLHAILRHAETLLDHWQEVEQLCARLPHTLVHADFQAKNLRVMARQSAAALMVFDWETAGCGPPGIDLAQIDLDEYARHVRSAWPALGASEMRALTHVGTLFRLASHIGWEMWVFDSARAPRPETMLRPMSRMAFYEPRLAAVMAELGWT
jgi:aminoglycoside phosphotransferase (APT) family kinase protein